MKKKSTPTRRRNYSATAGLTEDEKRWNKSAKARKGPPGSKPYKKYIWGHKTNVRKGKA